jgi:FkbM family methyltransferase
MSQMKTRDLAKTALRNLGIFPVARSLYRFVNSPIQKQKAKEIAFYRALLPPGSLCFDAGANLGQRTEIFLACDCRVVAIEPNPLCRDTLHWQFAGRCVLEYSAVGPCDSTVTLYCHGTDGTASTDPKWDQSLFGPRPLTPFIVPQTTLDDLIRRHGAPYFVNIDIEGFEVEALKGLTHSVPLLSFEFHSHQLDRAKQCLSLLGRLGTIDVRVSDMECNWISDRCEPADAIELIHRTRSCGDLFVFLS